MPNYSLFFLIAANGAPTHRRGFSMIAETVSRRRVLAALSGAADGLVSTKAPLGGCHVRMAVNARFAPFIDFQASPG